MVPYPDKPITFAVPPNIEQTSPACLARLRQPAGDLRGSSAQLHERICAACRETDRARG